MLKQLNVEKLKRIMKIESYNLMSMKETDKGKFLIRFEKVSENHHGERFFTTLIGHVRLINSKRDTWSMKYKDDEMYDWVHIPMNVEVMDDILSCYENIE
jgi:hypothetical protein